MLNNADLIYNIFFFFQAEDGIRDYKVTGVQTCALPISENDVSRGNRCKTRSNCKACRSCLRPRRAARPDCRHSAGNTQLGRKGCDQSSKTEEGNRCSANSECRETRTSSQRGLVPRLPRKRPP